MRSTSGARFLGAFRAERFLLAAVLAAVVAAAAGDATHAGARDGSSAATEVCRVCTRCGKQFRIVPNETPPESCPACGFIGVQASSADLTVTDWSRITRCTTRQRPPDGEETRSASVDAGTSRMNVGRAADTLNALAGDRPKGLCAAHVQRALTAGGVTREHPPAKAKDYGPYLLSKGFVLLADAGYKPQKGDVVVIQPAPGTSGPGHIAMFDGARWVSDYRQTSYWGLGTRPSPAASRFYRP